MLTYTIRTIVRNINWGLKQNNDDILTKIENNKTGINIIIN